MEDITSYEDNKYMLPLDSLYKKKIIKKKLK